MATKIYMAFGGPGCGKSTFCEGVAANLIESGVPLDQIVYTTFQRSAAIQAASRAGISYEQYHDLWYRTLHSACYKLLGIEGDRIVTPDKMRDFSKEVGVRIDRALSVEDDEMADLAEIMLAVQKDSDPDSADAQASRIISVYHKSRLASRTEHEFSMCRKEPHPAAVAQITGLFDGGAYTSLVAEYENWKQSNGLLDFTDMIERALFGAIERPPWKYVFVDEAQDLSSAQWRLVEVLFFNGPNAVFLAGDDNQAIMNFQMAKASDFLSYRSVATRIMLRKTHRFGRSISDLGDRIVSRLSEREARDMIPADISSVVEEAFDFDYSLKSYPQGKKFLLHRHKIGCAMIAKEMIARGVPFWNERGVNPLARTTEIGVYRAIKKMMSGEQVFALDAANIAKGVPSMTTRGGEKIRLIKHGSKKDLDLMDPNKPLSRAELQVHFTEPLWKSIQAGDWSVADVEFPGYYEAIERDGWDFAADRRPDAIIATIHASKGREADDVFLWDEVLPRCLSDETEHRVAYVGATRAKRRLCVVRSPITPWSTTHYSYPVATR